MNLRHQIIEANLIRYGTDADREEWETLKNSANDHQLAEFLSKVSGRKHPQHHEEKNGMNVFWVLTREINEYHQEGEYLVAVFGRKPSIRELCELDSITEKTAKYIWKGGGRINDEDEWFFLSEIQEGVQYQ